VKRTKKKNLWRNKKDLTPMLSPDDRRMPDGQCGLVYVMSRQGHRGPYLELLGPLLGLQSVHGAMSYKMFIRLVGARKLLFATLDQHTASFVAISVLRSVIGRRPTAALFLRASQCFIPGKMKFTIKRLLYQAMRKVPRLSVLTITPFDQAPHFSQVASDGVHDPQYWDKHDGTAIIPTPKTGLSERIQHEACGRTIVCALGTQSAVKGFEFLAEILANDPSLVETVFVVAAGDVPSQLRPVADRFVLAGGKLIDQRIGDDELESLYGIADMIWACYAPEYDQASGIFGRAVQYGVPVLVRKGSLIHHFASNIDIPVIPLEFDETDKAVELLKQTPPLRLAGKSLNRHVERIGSWRENFIVVVKGSLETKK
jgi:hypothetical protein